MGLVARAVVRLRPGIAAAAALAPALAAAREGEPHARAGAPWNPAPWVLAPLALAALLYALGRARLALRGRAGASRPVEALAFAGSLAAVAVALVSPMDRLTGRLLSIHMGEHELLMPVAAPHAVQHLGFFLTAVFFWWAVVHGRSGRAGRGVSVLAVS